MSTNVANLKELRVVTERMGVRWNGERYVFDVGLYGPVANSLYDEGSQPKISGDRDRPSLNQSPSRSMESASAMTPKGRAGSAEPSPAQPLFKEAA